MYDKVIQLYIYMYIYMGLRCWLRWWRIHLQCRRSGFDPWIGKISWRWELQPTPVFLPGEFHGQRSLVGYSPRGRKELDTTEWLTLSLFRCIYTFLPPTPNSFPSQPITRYRIHIPVGLVLNYRYWDPETLSGLGLCYDSCHFDSWIFWDRFVHLFINWAPPVSHLCYFNYVILFTIYLPPIKTLRNSLKTKTAMLSLLSVMWAKGPERDKDHPA